MERMSARGRERRLSFEIVSDPNLGKTMITDQSALMQVLKEPAVERIQFHRAGQREMMVAARWRLEPRAPGVRNETAAVAFEVSDTGIGIPTRNRS